MNSYEMTIILGWAIIGIGFIGALFSNYNFYTIMMLPIFLLIMLIGIIVWYFAVKERKDRTEKRWTNPKTLQRFTIIAAIGSCILSFLTWALKAILIEDIGGPLTIALVFFPILFLVHLIFGLIYTIIGLKIKKANTAIENEIKQF